MSPAKRHAQVEVLSMFGQRIPMAPIGLWVYANQYLQAAKAVTPDVHKRFEPTRAFLSCRALELVLKSFLSLKGVALAQLAGGAFGHDLASILSKAEKRGLAELARLNNEDHEAIERASKYYVEKVFEYPALMESVQGFPWHPDVDALIKIADQLVTALHEPCIRA